MSDHQADYPIATMCRLLGVSSSGYHAWKKRRPSQRSETDAALIAAIQVAHAASRGTYGAPRIHAELAAKGTAYWTQAGGAIDDAGRSRRCEPTPVRHHHGQGWWPAGAGPGRARPHGRSAGGTGGEAAWREWVVATSGRPDGRYRGTLQHTLELIAAGIDPGPPATT